MDIKAELRLMREQCPEEWEKIKENFQCPYGFDEELEKNYLFEQGRIYKNHCKE